MSEEQPIVSVRDLYKSFRLPHEQHSGVKQYVMNMFSGKRGYETQHVLKDVSFDIKKGEFFGIVGRNGSGKSTLLKLLAGIYTPDKGVVQVNGSLTPFIELGVGFNPELTGRENVFLNGALLGFSRKEMEAKYDDIVKFSELERFMDQKLKNYSSGMQVRLAFSIAIQAKSDILLLDEVLAVGDEAFQRKSLGVFEKYKSLNQTIILVTHDMSVVEKFCTRALMIDRGEVVKIGKPSGVAKLYSASNEQTYLAAKKAEEEIKQLRLKNGVEFELVNEKGEETYKFTSGDEAVVRLTWKNDAIKHIGLALISQSGQYVYGANTVFDKYEIKNNTVTYRVKLNLGAGDYTFTIGLFGEDDKHPIDFIEDGPSFIVVQSKGRKWGGLTQLESKWE